VTSGLRIADGKLAGRGVYATRDFEPGELVVPYGLVELTQTEFDALPEGEREWTHSFWGRIYHFPQPARYVNHADAPNTRPDLERMGNVGLRAIKAGEAITIDDRVELRNELDTFLSAYRGAIAAGDVDRLAGLLADDAIFSAPQVDSVKGKAAILRRLEQERAQTSQRLEHSRPQWVLLTYWTSVCVYRITRHGAGAAAPQSETHTSVLRRLNGSWRLLHQHAETA
jgi:ketosteroid isomerase-like protein